MHLEEITIIGAGLLGGSLGLAIRQRQKSVKVHALVRRPESVAECQRLGIAHFATQNMKEAVGRADLVILCTPLSQMRELALAMRPFLKPGAWSPMSAASRRAWPRNSNRSCARPGPGLWKSSHGRLGKNRPGRRPRRSVQQRHLPRHAHRAFARRPRWRRWRIFGRRWADGRCA